MFWSPAVTRLSVAFCCAMAGKPMANDSSTAMRMPIRCICLPPSRLLWLCDGCCRIEMQCPQRQCDADRLADREPARIVHQILLILSDAYGIAVKPAGIGALQDFAAQ